MYYNPEARREIKTAAKEKIFNKFWPVLCACAVCRLPMLLMGFVIPLAGLVKISDQIRSMASDSTVSLPQVESIINLFWSRLILVALILMVFDLLLTGPLYMGLKRYLIALYRGEAPELFETVYCFSSGKAYGLAFKTNLWIRLRWLQWFILLLPGAIVLGLLTMANVVLAFVGALGYFALAIWISVKVQTYDGAYNLLYDASDMPSGEAVRRAGMLFRSRLWEFFVFQLSFLGWAILLGLPGFAMEYLHLSIWSILVNFVLGLFFAAYQGASFVGYVDALIDNGKQQNQPENGSGMM